MSDLKGFDEAGVFVSTLVRNPAYTGQQMAQIKALSGPYFRRHCAGASTPQRPAHAATMDRAWSKQAGPNAHLP